MKRFTTALVTLSVLAVAGFSSAMAGETAYRFDPVTQKSRALVFKNTWAGYKIFRNNCKSCHSLTNDKNAPFLHTESKVMRAWNRVFLEKSPACVKPGQWDVLSKEQMVQLNDYLYEKARDTYNPNDAKSCG